jgi:hypothetical protein
LRAGGGRGCWLKTGRVARGDIMLATKVGARANRVRCSWMVLPRPRPSGHICPRPAAAEPGPSPTTTPNPTPPLKPTLQVSGYSVQNSYVRDPPETTRVTPAQIAQSVDASLKRLGTDYIDLLQIHWCGGRAAPAPWLFFCVFWHTRLRTQLSGRAALPGGGAPTLPCPFPTRPHQTRPRPDRYVPLFGAPNYDIANVRGGAGGGLGRGRGGPWGLGRGQEAQPHAALLCAPLAPCSHLLCPPPPPQEREFVPFDEQLKGLEAVIKAGKVGRAASGAAPPGGEGLRRPRFRSGDLNPQPRESKTHPHPTHPTLPPGALHRRQQRDQLGRVGVCARRQGRGAAQDPDDPGGREVRAAREVRAGSLPLPGRLQHGGFAAGGAGAEAPAAAPRRGRAPGAGCASKPSALPLLRLLLLPPPPPRTATTSCAAPPSRQTSLRPAGGRVGGGAGLGAGRGHDFRARRRPRARGLGVARTPANPCLPPPRPPPRRHNVSLLAYSPLAGGALSGKYLASAPAGARFNLFPG